jgi:putative ABC transport system substrate-binding protein
MKPVGSQLSVISKSASCLALTATLSALKLLLRGLCYSWLKPISGLRLLASGLCAMLFALSLSADAQQPEKVRRIGYLSGTLAAGSNRDGLEAFRLRLRELGYIEGQNITIEYRYAEGKENRLPDVAAELVRLKPEVIVTSGTLPTAALKEATNSIPIVVSSAGDLVGRGLIASLARPGGNITGSTSMPHN